MCAKWKKTLNKPGVMLWFRCGVFVNEVCLYREMVCIWYTMSGKQVNFECINDPCASSIYMWMHLCVCMRMRMCVFEGVCLYLSVTVYTLSAWGHLDWVCVVLSGESAHMCLREDLVLCGCVFDKLWEHVGDCLSIHLGESGERKSRMRRWKRSAFSLYLQVNLLTVKQTSLSLP